MMVDGPGGQIDDLLSWSVDVRLAFDVVKAQHSVSIGHIELITDERHAEGRIEALQKYRTHHSDAMSVHIAQQSDAIGAVISGARVLHHSLRDPAFDAFVIVGVEWSVGFSD